MEQEITARRFGRKFDQPCVEPSVIECAFWECQARNRCRLGGMSRRERLKRLRVIDPTPPGAPHDQG